MTSLSNFNLDPKIELLQWLARGSLKQNLLRAIRLWVWLKTLYGEENVKLELPSAFTLADWRKAFFSPTHPTGDIVPTAHDDCCACLKTTAQWLFSESHYSEQIWRESLQQHTPIPTPELDKLLQRRLFALTRRSLQGDLQILRELGWVEYYNFAYHRVTEFPLYPLSEEDSSRLPLLNIDLGAIADTFKTPLNHYPRFVLDVDYIVPKQQLDRVEDWHYTLREIWLKDPIPPLILTYKSARQNEIVQPIVYPLSLYYVRRAVYLCTYGQSPDLQDSFYNYRLDRVLEIQAVTWQDERIPPSLAQAWQGQTLPTPDIITQALDEAWGFDFYAQKTRLLLRFERDFHDRYVQQTHRHPTFKPVEWEQVKILIQQELNPEQQVALRLILDQRSPQDAYYCAWYRAGDINVIQRLRAWRPFCEVLLPWSLRQRMREEIGQEMKFYHSTD
ncbi:TIGR03985 family CRISPR-associated protein [Spirulina subsalsa]|uniref:TIGR03985 family CRISPR-associated protein n=1 Tax=Spirulina subsalsa TaxID=54311 RepID=UPI000374BD43|nr:TIGR03985 family CRISPR-associated protein [Spirulina subsalsa]